MNLIRSTRSAPYLIRVLYRPRALTCLLPKQALRRCLHVNRPTCSITNSKLSDNYIHSRLYLDTRHPFGLGRWCRSFKTSVPRPAQPPTADALMENLTDLYATAKDEFEIAMEETEANTVYAADDRAAAVEALQTLKEAFQQAVRESDPETAKEVQGRVGQRIRELEGAIENMEKMAMEGD